MLITFSLSAAQQNLLQLAYPKEFSASGPLEERSSSSAAPWGKVDIKERWFEGVCIFYSDFKVRKQAQLQLQCDSFCWVMNFMLEGELTTKITQEQLHLATNQYHTFYCPTLNTTLTLKQDAKVFTVCLTKRFIRKLLGKDLLPSEFESGGDEAFTMVSTDDYRQPPHV